MRTCVNVLMCACTHAVRDGNKGLHFIFAQESLGTLMVHSLPIANTNPGDYSHGWFD
jgi:hypothetical protein